ncbi:MAG TPA: EAL domain-containing protein [Acidimicrobiales bacterium]|nr:EAL domain-containing protein [Acidimicrobiales bacterium]
MTASHPPAAPNVAAGVPAGRYPRAPWAYLAANVPLVAIIYLLPRYHVYLWGLLGLGAAAAVVVGVLRNRPAHPMAWLCIALALTTFASGDITYDVETEFLHQVNPFPSVADIFYLATVPLLVAGLIMMVRARRRRDGDTGATLDALIITSGCAVLSWIFLIEPYVNARNITEFSEVVSIFYPLGDILILGVLVRLVFGGGIRNPSVRLLTVGAVGLLAADCIYGWIQLHGSWKVDGPTDMGWVLFYVLWGAAALHPSMHEVTVEQPLRPRHLKPGTLICLSGTSLVAPLWLVWRDVNGEPRDGGVLAGVSVVVFVFVILRLTGLARAQGSNARREQALRSFSERLVAATERSDVWDAAVAAVLAIGAAGVVGCIVTDKAVLGDEIVAATWAELVGARVDITALDGKGDQRAVCIAGGGAVVPAQQGLMWTNLRLPTSQGAHEQVLLAHDRAFPVDLRSILDAIAAQLTLALGRVDAARAVYVARTERKFHSMVQQSSDLITLLDADRRVLYQSPAVAAVLGRSPDALVGHLLNDLIHPEDLLAVQVQLTKVLHGGRGAFVSFECRLSNSEGQWLTVDVAATNLIDEPDVGAIVLNSRDVTERRALEGELKRQAFHDTLTGLANRALFLDRLSHAMDRGDRTLDPVAVLFLDIDDFKTVNDSLGHPAGDRLLVAVAGRLKAATRPGDTVARFGGDEFAVLVESGTMPGAAEEVARRIAEALVPTFRVQDNVLTVRASVGIALGRRPEDSPDSLLRDADLAMYLAKRNGKGRFEMYRPDMHAAAINRLETAADLRRGLKWGQFEVFYQPIVNTHTHQLDGAEALVRWRHPSRGIVPPLEFISIAEVTGLIVPLGVRVLRDAAQQAQAWRESGLVDENFYISVNLSARQLQDPGLLDDVSRALSDSGLPASALILEVTESTLVEDLDVTLPRLQALKGLGLRLAVDDFGTGYSSLSYLADLPVSVVKIDKSFIDRITRDADGVAMVRGLIDLSRALGLTCTAEGVERDNQLAVLDELGCESVQGYLFARPTSALDAAKAFTQLAHGEPTATALLPAAEPALVPAAEPALVPAAGDRAIPR